MTNQSTEEVIAIAPPADTEQKRAAKSRKFRAKTFDFLWKRDSHGTKKQENCQGNTDPQEVKCAEGERKNVIPNRMSFNFFKNIKRHVQIRNLSIGKSKRNTKEVDVASLQNDTNHDLVLRNDTSVISMETIAESSDTISKEENLGANTMSSQDESTLQSLDETLNYSEDEEKLDLDDSIIEFETDNNFESVPNNVYQSSSSNEIVQYHTVENPTENIQESTDFNESLNNENKAKASLTEELVKLSNYGWYWGPISGNEADCKLISEPDGAFLVRDSSDDRYVLTLSFKSSGKLLHARMDHSGGLFSLCHQNETEGFSSVADLIEYSMNFSQSAVFCYSRPKYPGYPSFPVRLTKPVSRFTQVRSLQYLCRFVIRQNTRLDNIHKLPLPKTIKGYIEEAHY